MRLPSIIGIVCAFAASNAVANDSLINQAKHNVWKKLNDPDSARFSDIFAVEKAGVKVVCGWVNAKNRYGGYEGRKPFLYHSGINLAC